LFYKGTSGAGPERKWGRLIHKVGRDRQGRKLSRLRGRICERDSRGSLPTVKAQVRKRKEATKAHTEASNGRRKRKACFGAASLSMSLDGGSKEEGATGGGGHRQRVLLSREDRGWKAWHGGKIANGGFLRGEEGEGPTRRPIRTRFSKGGEFKEKRRHQGRGRSHGGGSVWGVRR